MSGEQERQLAMLRTAYESGALDETTYETAVAAILGATFHAETTSGASAQGPGATAVGERGVNVGGDVGGDIITGNVYHGPKTADPDEALRIYRGVLIRSSETLPLRSVDIGASDAGGGQRPLGLANVYVALDTTSKADRRDPDTSRYRRKADDAAIDWLANLSDKDDREPEPIPALQKVTESKRLVLTGDPGSGKSTFVSHLAHCLAAHQLAPDGGWLDHLQTWPAEQSHLLPVVVILRDFAATLPEEPPDTAAPNALWRFITAQLDRQNLEFVAEPLRQMLEEGRALLLLDGLDEVTSAAARRFVRDAVVAFVRRYPHNRYLVTCRILSYQPPEDDDEPDLRLPPDDFPVAELAPFDEEQIDRFIDAWYGELVRLGTVRAQDRDGLVQRLKTAVRRPDLWRLAPNPLLLTVMALVHTHQGRLPDSRALLYENTVDMLLWRWEAVKAGGNVDAPTLRQLLLDAGRADMDLKRLLWRLAYEAHGRTDDGGDAEAVADISQARLTRGLERMKPDDWTWAHRMAAAMKLRAGLLLERAPGVFTFPHRTFQEYLAGAHLATQGDFSERAAALAAEGALWREAILLAVGRLVHLAGETDKPYALVNRLCPAAETDADTAWKNAWLAGDALLEIGLYRVGEDAWGAELHDRVRGRLARLVAQGRLTPRERMAAGDTLGRLGDPRPGVGTLEPDLVPVSAGPFLMGDERHEIEIAQPYAIGRYPVTNAQYQMFIDDGGYTAKWRHCWTEDGWRWREDEDRTRPYDWGDAYSLPNQPRVGVSWYEAVAYANWLAETTGKPYRLPTEAEWERAARHTDGRTYPWGEDWQDGMANTKEAGLERTTAVGIFPHDTAVCGAQDMSGNVNEWCQTRWRDEKGNDYPQPYRPDDGREELAGGDIDIVGRVIRGGAYFDGAEKWGRCAARYWGLPFGVHWYLGFRVVLSPFFDSGR